MLFNHGNHSELVLPIENMSEMAKQTTKLRMAQPYNRLIHITFMVRAVNSADELHGKHRISKACSRQWALRL